MAERGAARSSSRRRAGRQVSTATAWALRIGLFAFCAFPLGPSCSSSATRSQASRTAWASASSTAPSGCRRPQNLPRVATYPSSVDVAVSYRVESGRLLAPILRTSSTYTVVGT